MLKGYDKTSYTEQALALLEKDICYLARTNWGYGMPPEDVEQELRMHLWRKLHLYNPKMKALRTWAQRVMRMKLIDMSRKKKDSLDSEDRLFMYTTLAEKEVELLVFVKKSILIYNEQLEDKANEESVS